MKGNLSKMTRQAIGHTSHDPSTEYQLGELSLAQVFVFKGEECLGWDCFHQEAISVGSGRGADVRLEDPAVAAVHAMIHFKEGRTLISPKSPDNAISVNDKAVGPCILRPLDFITIGPYTLKVKSPRLAETTPAMEPAETPPSPGKTENRAPRQRKMGTLWKSLKNMPRQKLSKPGSEPVDEGVETYTLADVTEEITPPKRKSGQPKRSSRSRQRSKRSKVRATAASEATVADTQPAATPETAPQRAESVPHSDDARTVSLNDQDTPPPAEEMVLDEEVEWEAPASKKNQETTTVPYGDPDDQKSQGMVLDEEVERQAPAKQTHPKAGTVAYEDYDDEEDEDEGDDNPEPFLKDLLGTTARTARGKARGVAYPVLEVVKSKGESVVDVTSLAPAEKYVVSAGRAKFCIAERKRSGSSLIYFHQGISGHVRDSKSPIAKGLGDLKGPDNLHNKRKGIYGHALSQTEEAILSDGLHQYQVREVSIANAPLIKETKTNDQPFYKNLVPSVAVHLVMLAFVALVWSPQGLLKERQKEGRFVKVDTTELQKAMKAKPVVKPRAQKPARKKTPKASPKKIAKTPKKSTVTKKRTVTRKEQPKRLAKATPTATKSYTRRGSSKGGPVSSHPKAGGGSGKKGNVMNRNINQAGILGLIGSDVGSASRSAIAAVTNLDAVSSPGVSESSFKVGGVVGKLPGGNIEIPTGAVVRSGGGSRNVMRSVGVAGKGSIAALKKGKTGQGQVVGMVSVDLGKTVRVQGGMSREAVKRVIDQHIDEISFCYESALMDFPALMGNIVFEWKILLSGKVGEVRIKSSTIQGSSIHNCIKQAIKTWRFPQPKHTEVVVSYPFVFNIVGF